MTKTPAPRPTLRWTLARTLETSRAVLRALGDGLAASERYKRLRALGHDHATAAARALGNDR